MSSQILTQARLKELFDYDGERLIWKNSKGSAAAGHVAGYIDSKGYTRIKVGGGRYPGHRLIWLYVYGSWPENEIDHIDGDPSNNRIENLRDVARSINQRNSKKRANNVSGITGVSWDSFKRKWLAHIKIKGKSINLGCYNCKYRAASVRHLAQELHGGFTARHGK